MNNQRVIRMRVNVREMFPPDSPLVLHLLRLMAAVDDLYSLSKLYLYSSMRVGNTPSEKEIIEAESAQMLRLSYATFYEAGKAFQGFRDTLERENLTQILNNIPEGAQVAFDQLDRVFSRNFHREGWGYIVRHLRNTVFHYPYPEEFQDKLRESDDQEYLVIGEISGTSRYLVADELRRQISFRSIINDMDMQALDQTVLEMTESLRGFVDGMLNHLSLREGAITETGFDSVDIENLWGITSEMGH